MPQISQVKRSPNKAARSRVMDECDYHCTYITNIRDYVANYLAKSRKIRKRFYDLLKVFSHICVGFIQFQMCSVSLKKKKKKIVFSEGYYVTRTFFRDIYQHTSSTPQCVCLYRSCVPSWAAFCFLSDRRFHACQNTNTRLSCLLSACGTTPARYASPL